MGQIWHSTVRCATALGDTFEYTELVLADNRVDAQRRVEEYFLKGGISELTLRPATMDDVAALLFANGRALHISCRQVS